MGAVFDVCNHVLGDGRENDARGSFRQGDVMLNVIER